MQNTAPAAAEQTPRPLQLVPPPLQPLLPVSRRLPDAAPFVKRCRSYPRGRRGRQARLPGAGGTRNAVR